MTIGARIKEVRKTLEREQNLNMAGFAKKLGVSYQAVQNLEKRENLREGSFIAITTKFNVNPDWLKTGNGSMFLTDKKEPSSVEVLSSESIGNEFVVVKEFPTVKASAGYGAMINEEESIPYKINARFVENPEKEVIIGVIGNSMQPELYEGDKILITTDYKYTCKPKINGLYVIRADDCVYVKRYKHRRQNELIFASDNKKYPDIKMDISDGAERIIGKLKLHIREYK